MAIATNQQTATVEKENTFWPTFWAGALNIAQAVGRSLLSWSWSKSLLYWLILSGGTMAELAFLVGSVWMSLNATVHPFIRMFLSEDQTRFLSFLATSAYVALPELIVSLAVIVTIGHSRVFFYDRKKNWPSIIWTILYGFPALFFAGISAYTIAESVAHPGFTMPEWIVIARALAGYLFAFTSLLYWQLGKPQEADRLKKKDTELAALRADKEAMEQKLNADREAIEQQLKAEIARIQSELDAVYREKETAIREKSALYNALTQTSEDALQAYGRDVIEWLNALDKSVELDDIAAHTGITKRRLQTAIERGDLRVRGTNKNRIWVPSLREYLLKNAPKTPVKEQETGPILHLINE